MGKDEKFNHAEFTKNLGKIEKHLHPRQMLFLSADIVGSTLLKQSSAASFGVYAAHAAASDLEAGVSHTEDEFELPDGEKWFSVIQGFYIETVQSFEKAWRDAANKTDTRKEIYYGEQPTLWKTIGDEILFRKIITDHHQVNNSIKCWISAINQIRIYLKKQNSKLDVKCTAWIAEFPLQNKLVIGPSGDKLTLIKSDDMESVGNLIGEYEKNPKNFSDVRIDFVGPSIDIGFRLAAKSTNRKFVISLDVAYLIAKTNRSIDEKLLHINYDGREYLKGVLGGVEYPVFWIDMSNDKSSDKPEDILLGRPDTTWEKIKKFCESFYDEKSNPSYRPFVITDPDFEFHTPPRNYIRPYRDVADKYTQKKIPELPFSKK